MIVLQICSYPIYFNLYYVIFSFLRYCSGETANTSIVLVALQSYSILFKFNAYLNKKSVFIYLFFILPDNRPAMAWVQAPRVLFSSFPSTDFVLHQNASRLVEMQTARCNFSEIILHMQPYRNSLQENRPFSRREQPILSSRIGHSLNENRPFSQSDFQ